MIDVANKLLGAESANRASNISSLEAELSGTLPFTSFSPTLKNRSPYRTVPSQLQLILKISQICLCAGHCKIELLRCVSLPETSYSDARMGSSNLQQHMRETYTHLASWLEETFHGNYLAILNLSMVYAKGGKTIVSTQTKRDANELSLALTNSIPSEAMHGDISQLHRERESTLN
ncbi:hypothetical protein K1719_002685 [Acacia pycnantha]|nr:hypothetical protein K1719_002685 [Acacia pycnantha]